MSSGWQSGLWLTSIAVAVARARSSRPADTAHNRPARAATNQIMKPEKTVVLAACSLVVLCACAVLFGIPATGLVLGVVTVVMSAAVVQGYYRRRDHFHEHHDPEVSVRRRHMHGQDTLSQRDWPWP